MMNATTTTTRRATTATKPATATNGKPIGPGAAKSQELDEAIAQYRSAIRDFRRSTAKLTTVKDIRKRLEAANKSVGESMRSLGIESLKRGDQTFGDGRTVIDFPASSGNPWCQIAVTNKLGDGTAFRKWYVFCRTAEDWTLLVQSEPFFKRFGAIDFEFGVVATADLFSLSHLMEISILTGGGFSSEREAFRFLTDSPFATCFPQR